MLSEAMFAQGVAINNDGSDPDVSAMVDVKSTEKGVLVSRMTVAQRDAISSPAEGLMVFCTDCGSDGSLSVYSNGAWRTFAPCITSAPAEGIHVPSGNQIVWNWNSVTGATGYKWNTTTDYSTATDMGVNTSKIEPSLICGTSYTRYAWAYNGCSFSSPVTLTQSTLPCGWSCGDSIAVNHVVGTISPVSKTVTYGTVNNIPGETLKCWTTSNLGADHQADSVDDPTEPSAGWHWQFNRKQGYKHDGITRTPNTTWNTTISENSDWTAANDPCTLELGGDWRVPTSTEWTNVDASGGWADWDDPWDSELKLHAAGAIYGGGGSLFNRGSEGYYWSSTQNAVNTAWYLGFHSITCYINSNFKSVGFTLRCIKE